MKKKTAIKCADDKKWAPYAGRCSNYRDRPGLGHSGFWEWLDENSSSFVYVCILKKDYETKKTFHSTMPANAVPMLSDLLYWPQTICHLRSKWLEQSWRRKLCFVDELKCTRLYFFHFEYISSYSGYICGTVVYIWKVGTTRLNLWHL